MLSNPPATIISASPKAIAWAPIVIAFIPDAHTLLTLEQGTFIGMPAPKLAYLAGFYPTPAETTLPKITSLTNFGSKFMLAKAAFIAMEPNSGPVNPDNFPKREPIGVLFDATIKTCLLFFSIKFKFKNEIKNNYEK